MPKLLSIFLMGAEVRQFIHSGLFRELISQGWSIDILAKIVDDDLRAQLPEGVALHPLPQISHPYLKRQITIILDRCFEKQLQINGKKTWKFGKPRYRNWREKLLVKLQNYVANLMAHWPWIKQMGEKLERNLTQKECASSWTMTLEEIKPDAVLVNLPRNDVWDGLLSAAEKMGAARFVMYHTWKDVYAMGRITHRWTGIGVWNESMKSEVLRNNPGLDPLSVVVIGCGHFDCLDPATVMSDNEFRSLIGAKPNSNLIMYPTSGPGLIPGEERYIKILVSCIEEVIKVRRIAIQIVFRINPMEYRNEFIDQLKNEFPDHIILKPDWRYDPKKNWCFARKSDTILYNNLLHHSAMCITIPSTVTLDCAITGLPVINFGIEVNGPQPLAGNLRAFWEADFYENVRKSNAATFVTSKEELISAMQLYLSNPSSHQVNRTELFNLELNGISPGESKTRTARILNDGVQ